MSFLEQLPRGGTGRKRLAARIANKATPLLRQGHPWLFEDSIEKISGEGIPGDVAVLFDSTGKSVLGAGLFDPDSIVRIKVYAHGAKLPPVGPELFARLYDSAKALRDPFLSSDTTAWRMINGDSDGFPGLITDCYGDVAVMKLYSAALFPWIGDIADLIFQRHGHLKRLAIRLSRELQRLSPETRHHLEDGMLFQSSESTTGWDGTVRFLEHGLTFEADVKNGQKTGFFLDQRDNRAFVGTLARNASVLNLFSYSGGFSLSAARGGALEVTSVDFNKHAIAACDAHFAMNAHIPPVAHCRHIGLAGDAFAVMEDLYQAGHRYNIVVVDPPSFAKSAAEIPGALHSYARLARSAVRLVKTGGTLVFASCSSRVSADLLFDTVKNAASGAGFPLEEFKRAFHSFDHPAKFKESNYLKCIYAHVLRGTRK